MATVNVRVNYIPNHAHIWLHSKVGSGSDQRLINMPVIRALFHEDLHLTHLKSCT